LFFLLLPVRGRILPAPAGGHEFSVFIGPVLAYLIVRYRHFIRETLPREEQVSFATVSAIVFVIGLGSWRTLGRWLPPSPFDILYPLPGFRAVGIPARFWGYLALPLAICSAISIRAFDRSVVPPLHRKVVWAGIYFLTLGYLVGTLPQPFMSAAGRAVVPPAIVPSHVNSILNVLDPIGSQAATILPARGVIHAYNDHDYLKGDISPGTDLIRSVQGADPQTPPVSARWDGWNRIVVDAPANVGPVSIILNQNFHPVWRSSLGTLSVYGTGNMMISLPPRPQPTVVVLSFVDPASVRGRAVSLTCATVLSLLLGLIAFQQVLRGHNFRHPASPVTVATPSGPGAR
jgi:hypothetical protein